VDIEQGWTIVSDHRPEALKLLQVGEAPNTRQCTARRDIDQHVKKLKLKLKSDWGAIQPII
jgi:hypothetical protein